MLDVLYELLTAPDSYDGDWYGWITNQAGHMVLGAALAAILIYFERSILWVPVMYIPAEVIQWFFGGELLDAAADTLFVFMGAVLAWASWVNRDKAVRIATFLAALAAAIGISRRLK